MQSERCLLRSLLVRTRVEAEVKPDIEYTQITVKLYGKGIVERGKLLGKEIKTRPQFLAHGGDLIMSWIDARNGAFGIIPDHLDGALVTQDFPMFRFDSELILPEYLALLLKSDEFTEICKRSSRGTTNRKRLNEALFLDESIPLPSRSVQNQFLTFARAAAEAYTAASMLSEVADEIERKACNLAVGRATRGS